MTSFESKHFKAHLPLPPLHAHELHERPVLPVRNLLVGCGVQGSGFKVPESGFRIQSSGFSVDGSGLGTWSFGCGVWGVWCGVWHEGCGVWGVWVLSFGL